MPILAHDQFLPGRQHQLDAVLAVLTISNRLYFAFKHIENLSFAVVIREPIVLACIAAGGERITNTTAVPLVKGLTANAHHSHVMIERLHHVPQKFFVYLARVELQNTVGSLFPFHNDQRPRRVDPVAGPSIVYPSAHDSRVGASL